MNEITWKSIDITILVTSLSTVLLGVAVLWLYFTGHKKPPGPRSLFDLNPLGKYSLSVNLIKM